MRKGKIQLEKPPKEIIEIHEKRRPSKDKSSTPSWGEQLRSLEPRQTYSSATCSSKG